MEPIISQSGNGLGTLFVPQVITLQYSAWGELVPWLQRLSPPDVNPLQTTTCALQKTQSYLLIPTTLVDSTRPVPELTGRRLAPHGNGARVAYSTVG